MLMLVAAAGMAGCKKSANGQKVTIHVESQAPAGTEVVFQAFSNGSVLANTSFTTQSFNKDIMAESGSEVKIVTGYKNNTPNVLTVTATQNGVEIASGSNNGMSSGWEFVFGVN